MSGFQVTPKILEEAAQAVQTLPEELGQIGVEVLDAAEAAAAVNPEYLTSAAGTELAAGFTSALSAVAESLTAHAGGLGNSAATYESTEQRVLWMMDRVRLGLPRGASNFA